MRRIFPITGLTLFAGALAAVAGASEPEELDVRQAMVEGVNPATLAIWDVGNNALDEDGGLDPALMDDAAWARLHEAAQSLATYGHGMANAHGIRASGPDLVEGKVPEGAASREQIQAMIDGNPDGFRAHSAEMERQARAIADAAAARDLEAAGPLINQLDGMCESCHLDYWYPDQKALVESIRQAGGDDPAR